MCLEKSKKTLDEKEEYRELKEVDSITIPDEVYLAMANLRKSLCHDILV